ncbi:MAG: 16S rRNA (cytidine(1402)-2'-O)-methyltransferase [Anaerolineales bacterium]
MGTLVGTLYLVSTPIGNLEDISARGLRVLGQVSLIAAEDTRRTRKLLDHYHIKNQVISYHEHNKLRKLDKVLTALSQGDVALVSDAGTPILNDPGYELVKAVLDAGYEVSPIPGPSAPLAALVASGLPSDAFLYLGYLPRKSKERRSLLSEVADLSYTLIFLETPHRLLSAFKDLQEILGDRMIAVGRELTKLHEEIYREKISAAYEHFSSQPPRGEFTLVVSGNLSTPERWSEDQVRALIMERIETGGTPSGVAQTVSSLSGWPRREVYNLVNEIRLYDSGEQL